MTTTSLSKPRRGKEILRVIKDHGPLSIDLLHRMVQPQMSKKNLRKSLQVLKRKNLVEPALSTTNSPFYMTSQSCPSRQCTSQILDCNPDDIKQPLLRKQDWFHNQWCEYWIMNMKRELPLANMIREGDIGSNKLAMNVLQIDKMDYELRPDFLLTIPRTEPADSIFLAFEIERSRKSDERILRKFRKYMDGTKIDGLIYICDSGRLSETIRTLYQTKLLTQTRRQKRFGENFFLFSDVLDGGGPQLSRLFNACGKLTSFESWCGYLSSTKWTRRRDEDSVNW